MVSTCIGLGAREPDVPRRPPKEQRRVRCQVDGRGRRCQATNVARGKCECRQGFFAVPEPSKCPENRALSVWYAWKGDTVGTHDLAKRLDIHDASFLSFFLWLVRYIWGLVLFAALTLFAVLTLRRLLAFAVVANITVLAWMLHGPGRREDQDIDPLQNKVNNLL